MFKNCVAIAEKWYQSVQAKNFEEMANCLHPQVQFNAPLAKLKGKEDVLEAAKKFAQALKGLTIRTALGSNDQAMVVYDAEFPQPIGNVPSAALVHFQDGLISKFELFYDARPLVG